MHNGVFLEDVIILSVSLLLWILKLFSKIAKCSFNATFSADFNTRMNKQFRSGQKTQPASQHSVAVADEHRVGN